MGKVIRNFRELRVYKAAFDLQQEIFRLTKTFPQDERYALTSQIRRSSRSIGANLAEAWQKRRYPAHFISKLTDVEGEQAETQHWIETTFACEYVDESIATHLLERCSSIGAMVGSMIASPEEFCGSAGK